ncbi:MAG: hypothetical protein CMM91_06980 [Rickettsiales bacterium]|nr:hypothetical protein [Rickettsiales bacterium]|tara:strand:+ start:560 stop:1474 length:915 start_codon:yes stop_codon:yes gene_type:complete
MLEKKKDRFAAIDLGSNNCRLIIVELHGFNYKIIHMSSELINLGENLVYNNEFSHDKIKQVVDFFKYAAKKIIDYRVSKYRCVATEACRQSINSDYLVKEILNKTKLNLEIITTYEEARLCVKSCPIYRNNEKKFDLIFDIGGGSTELIFLMENNEFDFFSIPYGVVNLSEKIDVFDKTKILNKINYEISSNTKNIKKKIVKNVIGSCGTITTLCAIFQKLDSYKKEKVNEYLMSFKDLMNTSNFVKEMTETQKEIHPCIGIKRKKLLSNGILILEVISKNYKIENILVSDSGIKEGIIRDMIY